MKAIICTKYGPPEVLQLKEIERPVPKTGEILVKMHATAVTSGDARVRGLRVPKGFKFITRLIFGFRKPRNPILGMVLSGEVTSIGKGVKQFKIGDQIFGISKSGTYATYITIPERGVITSKPSNMSYKEAAAIPFGALSSLVYLRDFGKIQNKQKVLINGASGSLGTYAIQLAKQYEAEVIAVCSGSNEAWVKSLGADKVIDYNKEDFTRNDETYDIIYDTVGNLPFSRCKNVLNQNGRCLLAVAGVPEFLQVIRNSAAGLLPRQQTRKKLIAGVANFTKEDLIEIKQLIERGILKPTIDSYYPLEKLAEAHRYVDRGHKKGSVIIVMEHKD